MNKLPTDTEVQKAAKDYGVTRLAVLKGFDSVILGRDIAKNLKEGHVYGITEILGVLMINDLGEHAMVDKHSGNTISALAMSGVHCLTKEEYQKQKDNDI